MHIHTHTDEIGDNSDKSLDGDGETTFFCHRSCSSFAFSGALKQSAMLLRRAQRWALDGHDGGKTRNIYIYMCVCVYHPVHDERRGSLGVWARAVQLSWLTRLPRSKEEQRWQWCSPALPQLGSWSADLLPAVHAPHQRHHLPWSKVFWSEPSRTVLVDIQAVRQVVWKRASLPVLAAPEGWETDPELNGLNVCPRPERNNKGRAVHPLTHRGSSLQGSSWMMIVPFKTTTLWKEVPFT